MRGCPERDVTGYTRNLVDVMQVVLAALACPNLPLAPILPVAKEHTQGPVEDLASVYKPLEQFSTAGAAGTACTTGCFFEAVQGQRAYQKALVGNGECPWVCWCVTGLLYWCWYLTLRM